MAPKGFQGTSLLDYPGKIASLVFYGGCNLSCPYCHNPGLVQNPGDYPDIQLDDLLGELDERKRFIDGVVISGGEPTLAPDLDATLDAIKSLGLDVKLDTNGLEPGRLGALIEAGLVDYVALDLKTAPERYDELHRQPIKAESLHQTLDLLRTNCVEYEIRTTCVPCLVETEDIHIMGQLLRGTKLWALQQFVPVHAMDDAMRHLSPHAHDTLQEMATIARSYVDQVELRGI